MTKKISNLTFLLGYTTEEKRKYDIKHQKCFDKSARIVASTEEKNYGKSDKALWNIVAKRAIQMESSRIFIDDDCYLFDMKENVIFQTSMPEMTT